MYDVLFCSVWKSYFFALYGSRPFLLCMEVVLLCSVWPKVVLLCSVWKSYFFALYESRTFLLCVEVVLFCSVWMSYLWKSNFFALHGSRTSLLSVALFFSQSYFFPLSRIFQSYYFFVFCFCFFCFWSVDRWWVGPTARRPLRNWKTLWSNPNWFTAFFCFYFFYLLIFFIFQFFLWIFYAYVI